MEYWSIGLMTTRGACLASTGAGVKLLERCLACEADFERVVRDTSAMADKCEAGLSNGTW